MKIKTSELIDAALDWAVAEASGVPVEVTASSPPVVRLTNHRDMFEVGARSWAFAPTTHWAQGGPIIELNEIGSFHYIHGFHGPMWSASIGSGGFQQDGPTALIAAMRCFCRSKLGDEVDVPEELL